MESAKAWQSKEAALKFMATFKSTGPNALAACLAEVVPKVSECMWDTRPQVVESATKAMEAVCSVNGNRDLEKFLPVIIACIANPSEVPDCIHKLSATVFVQEVSDRFYGFVALAFEHRFSMIMSCHDAYGAR